MKKSFILLLLCLFSFFCALHGQNYNVVIEGQIVGYEGKEAIPYALSKVAGSRSTHTIKPDSLGRFVIKANIKGTQFFNIYYLQNNRYHRCLLVLKPNTSYSFISEGRDKNEWRNSYSPDIYTLELNDNLNHHSYKFDKGQAAYNLINNGIHGDLFYTEWDLRHPESLLDSLETKIARDVSVFDQLLDRNEISQELYDICKLNTEYMYAERLANIMSGIKYNNSRTGIKDTVLRERLYEIYPKIFEMYPVNEKNISLLGNMVWYTEKYLTFLEDYKDGKYNPIVRKGNKAVAPIYAKSGIVLPEEVNLHFQQQVTMNNSAALGTVTSEHIRKYLQKNDGMDGTYANKWIEEKLLPRVEEYEKFTKDPLPKNCYILDGDTINSLSQMAESFKGKALLIDFWGTWCRPCRYQFNHMDEIKELLEEKNMEMIYVAYEYSESGQLWESLMKAYDLRGFHFVANDRFKEDMKRLPVKQLSFPHYLIIDQQGEIVQPEAHYPSDGDKLYNQIKNVIN